MVRGRDTLECLPVVDFEKLEHDPRHQIREVRKQLDIVEMKRKLTESVYFKRGGLISGKKRGGCSGEDSADMTDEIERLWGDGNGAMREDEDR